MAVLAAVAGAAVGALLTLLVKSLLDMRTESRGARREFYVELMTLLASRRRVLEVVSFTPEETPDDIGQDQIDRLDARLMIDATPQVRALASACLRLLGKFNASLVMRAPVEVDEHGLYEYRFDLMRNKNEEMQSMTMRMALGGIYDDYCKAVDALATRVRRELHGARA